MQSEISVGKHRSLTESEVTSGWRLKTVVSFSDSEQVNQVQQTEPLKAMK